MDIEVENLIRNLHNREVSQESFYHFFNKVESMTRNEAKITKKTDGYLFIMFTGEERKGGNSRSPDEPHYDMCAGWEDTSTQEQMRITDKPSKYGGSWKTVSFRVI